MLRAETNDVRPFARLLRGIGLKHVSWEYLRGRTARGESEGTIRKIGMSSERQCLPFRSRLHRGTGMGGACGSRLHRGTGMGGVPRLGSAACVLADLQNAVMSISEAGFEVAVEEVRTLGGEF